MATETNEQNKQLEFEDIKDELGAIVASFPSFPSSSLGMHIIFIYILY